MTAPAYSCRKAAELLSKRLDEPLSRHERFELGLHLFLCRSCRHVRHQLDGIRSLSSGLFEGLPEPAEGAAGAAAPRPGRAGKP
jgi:hypothetical protein